MTRPPSKNYYGAFLRSPYHALIAASTLGIGFVSVQPLLLLGGIAAYALFWIYTPDSGWFRRWADDKLALHQDKDTEARRAEFKRRQNALLSSLSQERRQRYARLAAVCRDIETGSLETQMASGIDNGFEHGRKLDELMWTFLRLLTLEESVHEFLHTEVSDNPEKTLAEAEASVSRLRASQQERLGSTLDITADRLLQSHEERLAALTQRVEKIEKAKSILALVQAEEERLAEQLKLARADAVTRQNMDTLSTKIDTGVAFLGKTNEWIDQLGSFSDTLGEMPDIGERIGYLPPGTAPLAENPVPLPPARRPKNRESS